MFRYQRNHSGVSRFVQRGYSKKCRNVTRDDWRVRKGFARDQAKHRIWCKCGRYLKTLDHRLRRQFERELISHRDWDGFFHHKEQFVSSWDAC